MYGAYEFVPIMAWPAAKEYRRALKLFFRPLIPRSDPGRLAVVRLLVERSAEDRGVSRCRRDRFHHALATTC